MKKLRSLFVCGLALVMMLSMIVVVAPRARAYGPTALWQIGFSGNCFNPAFCPGGSSGFWGWIVLETGAIGDLVVTDYIPSGSAQVQPTTRQFDITSWGILPIGPPSGFLTLFSATLVSQTGPGTGFTPTFPFPIAPAAPGHYQFTVAPGVVFIFQVAQVGVGG